MRYSITQQDEWYLQELKNEIVEKLKNREKYILFEYFGLDGNKPKTLMEIGKELMLSRERIRQIKEKALRRLYRRSQQCYFWRHFAKRFLQEQRNTFRGGNEHPRPHQKLD